MSLRRLLGIELPIVQAPMAGAQGSALTIAVSNAGGLGSLPCALLDPAAMHAELTTIKAATTNPFNVNFFCHAPPPFDPERDAAWRELGPLSSAVPEFPLALSAMNPVRVTAESRGSADASFWWCGQNASGCKEISAAELTHELAVGL